MSKLAHSDDDSMARIESNRLLAEDPTMFRCCGCGLACPENVKPCDCITGVGFRMKPGSSVDHVILTPAIRGVGARLSVREWLLERLENCERIAKTKTGDDRALWLEDRDYFRQALNALSLN